MLQNRREILYPQFFTCCEKVNYFWIPIFEDLAYGFPLFNSILDGNVLKNKEEEYIIHDEIDFEAIQNMFPDVKEPKSYIEGKKWSDIKRKNIKNHLLELYAIENTDTIEQSRIFLSEIKLQISLTSGNIF